jgi:outer membrane protein assembly factor BamB/tRNA A-37 threonylcarbamoyl transferase component Bud32
VEPVATGAFQPQQSGSELVQVLDRYLADLQTGQVPDRAQLLAAHPEIAAQLEQCLAGIEFIHHAARSPAGTTAQLGDFRIVREVGRGGMGVVYEAEQLSLKRKVALKVLRFGAVADAEVMKRFQREAETVARLHHTNIVPIFAVGCENGVHYYAMQLIEGRSLAAIVEESRQSLSTLAARDIARWGLQAAEALAHAHQRGVIHRDIKPANLLLDPEGVIWLTDFGLAKRADEVTLTLAGVLIGTPRYMSPEQAASVKQPVDHRTDVYSLGATLYELSTGQPVFQADTPHGVISQILNNEPVAPRQVQPGLPRDLETIILKCLNKEPARRFATAEALAADLRAFLEGRAIKARRPSLAERAVRWAKKQRQSALPAVIAAAATVLLVLGSIVGWGWYKEWRKGQIVLTTDGSGLEAEVLDDNDELVLPPFAVSATPQPTALPAGNYRVRLSAPGPLSEIYQLVIEQGVQQRYEVRLGDRQLWPPLEVTKGFEVVELDGRSDVILLTDTELRRMNGATGKDVWQRSLKEAAQVAGAARTDIEAAFVQSWFDGPGLDRVYRFRPWSARPAPELEGDGNPYLVWACQPNVCIRPWLLAVSANDGKVKWWYGSEHLTGKRDDTSFLTGAVCSPLVADVDGDGKPDLIATFGCVRNDKGPRPWVEAISGRTGRLIWRYAFDRDVEASAKTDDYRVDAGYASLVTEEGGRHIVVVMAGRCLVGLDLRTGKAVWPVRELNFVPFATPVIADLKGDGRPAWLLLKANPQRLNTEDLKLIALSIDGQPLWEHSVAPISQSSGSLPELEWPVVADLDGDGKPEVIVPYHNASLEQNGWVGIEVLDGATGQSRWRSRLSRGYRGAAEYTPIAHFAVGPDLDGDGCRDIFTAALIEERSDDPLHRLTRRLVVAASSGANGRLLWRKQLPLDQGSFGLSPLRWASSGADGRSQLAVSIIGTKVDYLRRETQVQRVAQTLLFSAADGRLQQRWRGVSRVETADFHGDGIPDLYCLRFETEKSAKLYGIRGDLPESRRLGTWQPAITGRPQEDGQTLSIVPPLPLGDLDGDGVPDIIVFHPLHWTDTNQPPTLCACSGKDGRRLWQVDALPGTTGPNTLASKCYSLECLDLDGHGRPEVVVTYRLGQEGGTNEGWLAVLSGPTGKVLWKRQLGGFTIRGNGWTSHTAHNAGQRPELVDLKGDGVLSFLMTVQTEMNRQELHALEALNGRLLWKHSLEPDWTVQALVPFEEVSSGNRTMDFLVTSRFERHDPPFTPSTFRTQEGFVRSQAQEVLTRFQIGRLNGQDGQSKWTWSGPEETECFQYPILADLFGDGRRSVCTLIHDRKRKRYQLLILDCQGQRHQTLDMKPSFDGLNRFQLGSHDLDGSGKEDLLVTGDGKVLALRAASRQLDAAVSLRWEWPMPEANGQIVDIRPAASGQGAVVVVRSAKALHGLDGPTGKPLWEAKLDLGVRGVFGWNAETPGVVLWPRDSPHDDSVDFQPSMRRLPDIRPAVSVIVKCSATVVPLESHIEGLDPSTGKVRWRCEGPGRATVLVPGANSNELPQVWFHTSLPVSTIVRRTLAVRANDQYGLPDVSPVAYEANPGDPWVVLPLPWEGQARSHRAQAIWPGAACLGLLAYFAWARRRRTFIGLTVCFVFIPVVVALLELRQYSGWIAPEQHYAWAAWYWIWPYTLSVAGTIAYGWIGVILIPLIVISLPAKWLGHGLCAIALCTLAVLLWIIISSAGPRENLPWWEQELNLPRGLTFSSPLVWMLAWLLWETRRGLGKSKAT